MWWGTSANTLKGLLEKPASGRKLIGDSTIAKLMDEMVLSRKKDRELFTEQVIYDNKFLARPLGNLDITVCNILGSKGLGADVVFVLGFDQGKLPAKNTVEDSEIYQILVALTRTKKRIYLVNTSGCTISNFINSIDKANYQIVT